MRIVKQISATVLLVMGFWCLARAVETGLDRNPNRLGKRETITAGVLLGVPAVGFGTWLGVDTQLQRKREERDRLQGIFFKLVKAGKGYIAPIRFSMETGLTGEAAIDYLNQRARVYNADFKVDDMGGITYYFNLGNVDTQLLNPAPEQYFDVILEVVPGNKRREIVKTLKQMTGWSWKEVKSFVKAIPQPIQRNVSQKIAEDYKHQLEGLGAQVALILRSHKNS